VDLSTGEKKFAEYGLNGRDLLCGSLVLAIMILPIITAISRDVLRSVPRAQVEGTVALGATWWQSSRAMFRYSRSALFGAVMLGLARAAGETMAVTMVIGNNTQVRASPFAPLQTMSSLLANEFAEANNYRPALCEVALILLVMSLVFNVVARQLVVGKQSRTAAAH
jgi:phosphate transport system permease protein